MLGRDVSAWRRSLDILGTSIREEPGPPRFADKSEWAMDEGTDAWAMKQKHISITPLHMNLTAETNAPHLDEVLTRLRAGLQG